MAILASLLLQFGLESSDHMVCFERLGVRRIEVRAPANFFLVLVRFPPASRAQIYDLPWQELQDVSDADIEGLGLKAVSKNRMLRLLAAQKARSAAMRRPFPYWLSNSVLIQY